MKIVLFGFFLFATTLSACSSVKTSAAKTVVTTPVSQEGAKESLCNRTVKLYIEKGIVITESGEEKESNNAIELILNPGDGQITLTEVNESKSGKTAMKVESCNLTAGMKSGEAVYTMNSEGELENGNTVVRTDYIKLEAVNGTVTVSVSSPGKAGGLKAVVSHWKVID